MRLTDAFARKQRSSLLQLGEERPEFLVSRYRSRILPDRKVDRLL
jgi:hypothetical protein